MKINIENNTQPETKRVSLTPREAEILTLVAVGKSRNEVGTILSISEDTVKAHLKKTYKKLDVVNRTQAALAAYQHGLINLRP